MNDTVLPADRRRLALLGLAAHRFRVKAMISARWLDGLAASDQSIAPIAKLTAKASGAVWKLEDAIAALEARGRGEVEL